jgi:hypothetical protein
MTPITLTILQACMGDNLAKAETSRFIPITCSLCLRAFNFPLFHYFGECPTDGPHGVKVLNRELLCKFGLDSSDSRQRPTAGLCIYGNEIRGYIQIVTSWLAEQLLAIWRKTLFHAGCNMCSVLRGWEYAVHTGKTLAKIFITRTSRHMCRNLTVTELVLKFLVF